jgi:excisionase family DNA binding protein
MTNALGIETPWLTQKQAVAYSQRSERTINEALRNGELRGHQRGRGCNWLIHRDDLDAWIRGEIASAEPPAVTRPRAVRA